MAEAQSTLFEDMQKQYEDYRKWVNPEGNNILKDMLTAGGPNGDPAAMERVVGNVGGAGGIKNVGGKIARRAGESVLSWYQRIKQAGNAGKAAHAAAGTRRADIAGQVAKENTRVAGGGGGTRPMRGGPRNQYMTGGRQMMQDAQGAAAKDARFRTGEKVAAGGLGAAVLLDEMSGVTSEDVLPGDISPKSNVPQYPPHDPQGLTYPENMTEDPMVIPVPPPPRQASPNPDPIVAARALVQEQQKEAAIQKMHNAYYGQGPYYDDTLNPTDNFRAGLDAFGQAPRQFRRR